MSAWIVSKRHIDVLVSGLVRSEVVADAGLTPDELGQALWEECHRSVNYRYDEETPTPPYTHEHAPVPPGVLLVQIDCYDYQSCEHPGWETSAPRDWCARLRAQLVRAGVCNSPDAPWGID